MASRKTGLCEVFLEGLCSHDNSPYLYVNTLDSYAEVPKYPTLEGE